MSLVPRNWSTFQHYKDRKPSWIKLHHELLDDFEFFRLPVASRALAPCLWLLASEYEDGEITASLEEIAFRLRMSLDELCQALGPLVEAKFFIASNNVPIRSADASVLLAEPEQVAIPERERETEKEIERRADARAEIVSCGTSPPPTVESPKGLPAKYAFDGDVIRLTKLDFEKWAQAYPRIDLRAELTARDAWLATSSAKDRERWFVSTAAHLKNQNAKALAQQKDFKWASGIEGVY